MVVYREVENGLFIMNKESKKQDVGSLSYSLTHFARLVMWVFRCRN